MNQLMALNHLITRHWRGLMGLLGCWLLVGCATTGSQTHPQDPFESWNRGVYQVNDTLDRNIMQPAAIAYTKVVPSLVRTGVNNFFGNLGDLWSSFNAALQLRPKEAIENLMRFSFNSTLGLGGLIDIAGEMGMERTKTDLGQTLGRWGVGSGPYLMLPLLGPSTLRDGLGLGIEIAKDPLNRSVPSHENRTGLSLTSVINTRTGLLGASRLLNEASLDPYAFLRDAYLQRRQNKIQDLIDEGIHWPGRSEASNESNESTNTNESKTLDTSINTPATPTPTPTPPSTSTSTSTEIEKITELNAPTTDAASQQVK